MTKLLNKFLIVLVVIIILIIGYLYFSSNPKFGTVASSSSLSSSVGTDISTVASSFSSATDKITSDTAFISKLTSLTTIKIDDSLFTNKLFTSLNDNNIDIQPEPIGRANPFSIIGSETTNIAVTSPVITNDATQVTDKTAILNGTVSESTATSVYFKYGTTQSFGKTTGPLKQSLIGGFNINITGLISKTTYFYVAVAKINGVLTYGGTISFTTQ